jgi:hypothetical protein
MDLRFYSPSGFLGVMCSLLLPLAPIGGSRFELHTIRKNLAMSKQSDSKDDSKKQEEQSFNILPHPAVCTPE